MEYVAGKTLDQLIGRKGLRLNESLKYAIQIADALSRALRRHHSPRFEAIQHHGGRARLGESARLR
jgi:hypothetical protein